MIEARAPNYEVNPPVNQVGTSIGAGQGTDVRMGERLEGGALENVADNNNSVSVGVHKEGRTGSETTSR